MSGGGTPRLDAVVSTTEGTWLRLALIDIAGDLVAGVLLSQLVYWSGTDRTGAPRMTIEREGRRWLAKPYSAWWDECRVTEDQARRVIGLLRDKGLVQTRVWHFKRLPTVHVRLVGEAVEGALAGLASPSGSGIIPSPSASEPRTNMGEDPEPSAQNPVSLETETTSRDYGRDLEPLSLPATDEHAARFAHVWDLWAPRGGKKLHKAKALALFRALSLEDQRAAFRGARNYRQACDNGTQGRMDLDRWLRCREWVDWQTPPEAPAPRGGPTKVQQSMASADGVARRHATDQPIDLFARKEISQ